MSLNQSIDEYRSNKEEVMIKVENFDNKSILVWSVKKFYDKLEMIKDNISTF